MDVVSHRRSPSSLCRRRARICTRTHARTHTHANARTHADTHIHTYTYTHTSLSFPNPPQSIDLFHHLYNRTNGVNLTEFFSHPYGHVRAYQDPMYHQLLVSFFERCLTSPEYVAPADALIHL